MHPSSYLHLDVYIYLKCILLLLLLLLLLLSLSFPSFSNYLLSPFLSIFVFLSFSSVYILGGQESDRTRFRDCMQLKWENGGYKAYPMRGYSNIELSIQSISLFNLFNLSNLSNLSPLM